MHGPPPPWFFLALFPVLAVSVGIVVRSVGTAIGRIRAGRAPVQLPPPGSSPQMAQIQAELDELRTQVERLSAAQAFYAQLQPVGAPAHNALPGEHGAALS
ncbi:MAG TPA: hypothetical protein VFS20_27330 [Longimicrobium sp.]|nr:hypothetical protein [Longimicrobium sp.]